MPAHKEEWKQTATEFDERYRKQVDAGFKRRNEKKLQERDAYLEKLKKGKISGRN
ncbi:MAG: hypothetical protein ABI758_06660 [Candidatus Woesebacteria bacterium]